MAVEYFLTSSDNKSVSILAADEKGRVNSQYYDLLSKLLANFE